MGLGEAAKCLDPRLPSKVCAGERPIKGAESWSMHMMKRQASGGSTLWSLRPFAERAIAGLETSPPTPPPTHPLADYDSLFLSLIEEYAPLAERKILRILSRKTVDIYSATAPMAGVEEAKALCRLSLEWWLINSALDYKHTINLTHDECRRLLLEGAAFFQADALPSAPVEIPLQQQGFAAVARLAWQRAGASTVWMQTIASELRRYIFSRNIGVRGRMDVFDSIDEVIRVRCDDGGMIAQILLTEVGDPGSPSLSDETRQSTVFVEALRRLSTIAALLNDIASVVIDLRSGALNTVLYLYEGNMLAMNERDAMRYALEDVCTLLEQENHAFLHAARQLEELDTDSSQDLQKYANYLRSFLRGYWKWQLTCPSYFEAEHPVVEFRHPMKLPAGL